MGMISRRQFGGGLLAAAAGLDFASRPGTVFAPRTARAEDRLAASEVILTWYRLVLELVRHTPTYSPPVASRAFAYLGVTGWEALAATQPGLVSLAGQLNGLTASPAPDATRACDETAMLNAALAAAVGHFFSNTGPTGQRAIRKMTARLTARVAKGADPQAVAAGIAHGETVADHILTWSMTDGGAVVENMGFPLTYALSREPGRWTPTSLVQQQQMPLLPGWGNNRSFATPSGKTCGLPPPPDYSESPGSAFYREAEEVRDAVKTLTPEQRAIARFWSDDPMLSPTPPGHWLSIAMQIAERDRLDAVQIFEVLARLGITLADAFIGCWDAKYRYDLIRPITYIRKVMDPGFEPILNTPPFPEYPSGHSTQSGAAEVVLTQVFGETFSFDDATHVADGIAPRHYASFRAAAEEAGISRLYGGIHFRSAIDRGLEQGRCIGAYAARLTMRG
ncbi:PAP2 superfamily protein [Rhizobium sp. RU20A]|uniref:vanadium-dependent haloperoxidase n=1 Tax=Rhizobium sp. RU20A TaxID=1907412 RepID=UPI000956047D|nr:vanadium-dependent haloperoxidase [Rhizobium sp. RU20A]SIQ61349.1 PAP2 superfamily protein [Rhizobium sp. RU20A]